MAAENIRAINVYDENILPENLKAKLSVYEQESAKLLSDSKTQIAEVVQIEE
jgi:hypothetical protein